ncbi:MAG: hypothetical protein FWH15_07195 [Betaproteobacteria bacterium]|nr:hypothetical protein [Betaproteobacteria bacterium]
MNAMIRRYMPEDENQLFTLMEHEGEEWKNYWGGENKAKYRKAIASSIVYVLYETKIFADMRDAAMMMVTAFMCMTC